jgi:hypothetical protein
MAYTPSARKTKTSPNNTAGLPVDSNRVAIQAGNFMQSQDATGTPVVSPTTNMSASGVALTVPQSAVRFTINSTVATQVGEDSTYAQGFTVPAATSQTFDVANQAFVYVKPSNGTNVTQFYFTLV